ncbi:hypothetical protein [Clostridium culturomicium]|uniref:hypothetical protein n=1 Tax=Clostridium culturomicium TaxID=1499683 RepID=UPI0038574CCA
MEMMIAIIVLAAAATLSFMSFVTLKKQIEVVRKDNRAHWKSVEYSLEIQSNQISNEIQEGKTFNDNAFAALNENIITCKTELMQESARIIKEIDTNRTILVTCVFKNEKYYNKLSDQIGEHDENVADDCEVLKAGIKELGEKMEKSTRDINFITKQQAGRVITTPLKVMWEQPKMEAKSGN